MTQWLTDPYHTDLQMQHRNIVVGTEESVLPEGNPAHIKDKQ